MGLSELIERAYDRFAALPAKLAEEARRTNTTVSYTDPAYGTDVIREYPDGRRERLCKDGSIKAIPALP